MEIRHATLNDLSAVKRLTIQIGAAGSKDLSSEKLSEMINSPDMAAFICCQGAQKLAFIGMEFVPDAASIRNFAVISHFALSASSAQWRAAEMIEAHAAAIAVACSSASMLSKTTSRRAEAGRFYLRQGYKDLKTHFIKNL